MTFILRNNPNFMTFILRNNPNFHQNDRTKCTYLPFKLEKEV